MRARPHPALDAYVAAQRYMNTRHADGSVVKCDESYPFFDFVDALEMLEAPSPKSILVIGCRVGYECAGCLQRWPLAHIVGVDIVSEFVMETRKVCEAQVADMHALPFKEGSFEWVFSAGILEHAYDAPLAAREMLRVASRGIYVTADIEEFPSENASHWTCTEDPKEWEHLFEVPGWRIMGSEVIEQSLHLLLLRGEL